jgi:hypothetical protein
VKKRVLFPALTALIVIAAFFFYFSSPLPDFQASEHHKGFDYSLESSWACLPFRKDVGDIVPDGQAEVDDALKQVDVFYIYPTIYTFGKYWNADPGNQILNFLIDQLPVKYHASVFNHVGRVYVPRYRQAILQSYSDTTGSGQLALDFAYEDVKRAFEYYMEHHNQGRPIILASHSQGTTHSRRLLRDYFDNPEMKDQLVCAYLVGNPLFTEDYQVLSVCDSPEMTNCYVGWCSIREGFEDTTLINKYRGEVCVNPVSWRTDESPASTTGAIFKNFERSGQFETIVYIKDRRLAVSTNHWFIKRWEDLHNFDFNLFWHDIRENASLRVEAYLKGKS